MAAGRSRNRVREDALRRAERAFPLWAGTPLKARIPYFRRLRRTIVLRQRELATLLAEETGKPVTESLTQEITSALEMIRYMEKRYPRWLKDKKFRYWRPGFWRKANTLCHEPLGVVAVIGPANFPFSIPVMQACSALLCGNGVILKASERCPATARWIRRLFQEARFPEGVVEIVEGGARAAEAVIGDPAVRKVIFTGGSGTGKRISALCGRFFKPCVLELGGEGAAIIDDQADLNLAAKGLCWSAFYARGESCIGTKTIYVTGKNSRAFAHLLAVEAQKIKAGDPLLPDTDIGPSMAGRVGRVEDIIREVDSSEQAVEEANRSGFGLGASVWSRDRKNAESLARGLQTGLVWINDTSIGLPNFPWGGTKDSGWGRLYSKEGLREMTRLKVISHDRRRSCRPRFWWFPYSRKKFETVLKLNRLLNGFPDRQP